MKDCRDFSFWKMRWLAWGVWTFHGAGSGFTFSFGFESFISFPIVRTLDLCAVAFSCWKLGKRRNNLVLTSTVSASCPPLITCVRTLVREGSSNAFGGKRHTLGPRDKACVRLFEGEKGHAAAQAATSHRSLARPRSMQVSRATIDLSFFNTHIQHTHPHRTLNVRRTVVQ